MNNNNKGSKIFFTLLALVTMYFLAFYVTKYAINSNAAPKPDKGYYWCTGYRNGVVMNRYCYGNTGMCQTYNLYRQKPVNNPKQGIYYYCYSDQVFVKRKGSPCPKADSVVETRSGYSIGCFGGFKETNLKILD